jgi:hemoglobin
MRREMSSEEAAQPIYLRVGGRDFFVALVERFYEGVVDDDILRPMYEDDLDEAKHRLVAFLSQYYGGTNEYEELRGSPMLRARHLRFPIDEAAKDRWLEHMGAALDRSEISASDREELWRYFVAGANFFVNRGGLGLVGG